jgi:hypothetical protein
MGELKGDAMSRVLMKGGTWRVKRMGELKGDAMRCSCSGEMRHSARCGRAMGAGRGTRVDARWIEIDRAGRSSAWRRRMISWPICRDAKLQRLHLPKRLQTRSKYAR